MDAPLTSKQHIESFNQTRFRITITRRFQAGWLEYTIILQVHTSRPPPPRYSRPHRLCSHC